MPLKEYPFSNQNISVQYWSDFLHPALHAKSVCEMPLWTNKTNFDTYFAGNSDELVPPDVREGENVGYKTVCVVAEL